MSPARVQPFRSETLGDESRMRLQLNDLVRTVNDFSGRWRVVSVPNVQSVASAPALYVTLPNPGFIVGAILVGGVWVQNNGSAPTSAPWAFNWATMPDGRIQTQVGGLVSGGSYRVNFVLLEGQGTQP